MKKTISQFTYRIKRLISKSSLLGKTTNLLEIHNSRIGCVRDIVPASALLSNTDSSSWLEILKQGESIRRRPPKTLETNVHKIYEEALQCYHSNFFLLQIENGFALSNSGWIITSDRRFLLDSLADPAFVEKRQIDRIFLWPDVTELLIPIIIAYSHWAVDNYYHWMLEVLPRLSPILDPPEFLKANTQFNQAKIIIPPKPLPWMIETLSLLGFAPDQLYFSNGNQLKAKDLFFLSRLGQPMNTPLWAIDWLRNSFAYWRTNDNRSTKKRLLISRCKAKKRRIVNEEEVLKALYPYGFDSIVLEDMNVRDQIALFSQAEIIVAPHGAGLTNLVFANNVILIEIFEPSWLWPTFYALSQDCGHDYWYLIGETVEDVNIWVDVSKLMLTLERAITERELNEDSICYSIRRP
jgi:hypothetical protein